METVLIRAKALKALSDELIREAREFQMKLRKIIEESEGNTSPEPDASFFWKPPTPQLGTQGC